MERVWLGFSANALVTGRERVHAGQALECEDTGDDAMGGEHQGDAYAGPLHAYLAGEGRDGRGRLASEVLAFSDARLEAVHDYIQWLFPLPTRSSAQPDAPVLTGLETDAIRADPRAADTLVQAADRMLRFYRDTDHWLVPYDHNHLRITRILGSLKLLVGPEAARRFHSEILALHQAAGAPVNARSLRYWAEAAA